MTASPAGSLEGEDGKLFVLARAARLRAYAPAAEPEGAALRDTDGRTYTAATVAHTNPALGLSALRGAVSAAVSSGARSFEAAVVVGAVDSLAWSDVAALGEFGTGVPVFLVSPDGDVVAATTT